MTAYFSSKGRSFRKHQAVEQAVHRDLVKEGLVAVDVGSAYTALFGLRAAADYVMELVVTPHDASDAIRRASTVLDAIGRLELGLQGSALGHEESSES